MSKCISLRLKIGSQAVKKSQVLGAPLYYNVFLPLNPAVQGSSSALLSSGLSTVIGQTNPHVRPPLVSDDLPRLRAVSYFSLQSYCARNPRTRATINEGVFLVSFQSLIVR